MALTASKKYYHGQNVRPSGQVVTLPGSSVFSMPHSIPDELDFYTIDTVQRYPLGTKLEIDDNVFRYVEFGGTTKAGDLMAAEAPDAAHDDLDPTGGGTGAGVAIGDKIISMAASLTFVVDEYAGGYMVIEADTGVGYTYFIEANEAKSGAVDALFRIKLGLAIALDSTSDVTLVKSRFKEVVIIPTSIISIPIGVSVGVGADGSFGWAATKGPWTVLTSGTVVIGEHVRAMGVTTAGAVIALNRDGTAEDEAEVGLVMNVGPTTEQSLIALDLE